MQCINQHTKGHHAILQRITVSMAGTSRQDFEGKEALYPAQRDSSVPWVRTIGNLGLECVNS